jgi:hypothetical protein
VLEGQCGAHVYQGILWVGPAFEGALVGVDGQSGQGQRPGVKGGFGLTAPLS